MAAPSGWAVTPVSSGRVRACRASVTDPWASPVSDWGVGVWPGEVSLESACAAAESGEKPDARESEPLSAVSPGGVAEGSAGSERLAGSAWAVVVSSAP